MTLSTASFRLWEMSAERKRKINWVARAKAVQYLNETATEAINNNRISVANNLIETSEELLQEAQAIPPRPRSERTVRKAS